MNNVKELQEKDFQKEVLESAKPVLVDFFAPWCGPCRALAPILEGAAKTCGDRMKFVKVNVDDAQELAVKYGIRGVPTLMFFKDGKAADTMVGLPRENALREKIEALADAPELRGACGCGCGCG